MSKKSFFHYRNKILFELEKTYPLQPMHCIKYIISDLKSDDKAKIANAYHWTMTEADKIRYSKFDDVFYRYHVYESVEHCKRRERYLRRIAFLNKT